MSSKTNAETAERSVLTENPWKQAKLFVNGKNVYWDEEIVLRRGQANTVELEALPPIVSTLKMELVNDDGLAVGTSPAFGSWVPLTDGKVKWTVTPEQGKSGRVTLVIFSREVVQVCERPSLVLSTHLADEVDKVLVEGAAYPVDGIVLFRDEPQTITLTFKPGSPLQNFPLRLIPTVLTGLPPHSLVVTSDGPQEWTVKATNYSGTFQLDLEAMSAITGLKLPVSMVLSSNLAEEAKVEIDGVTVSHMTIWFQREKPRTIKLVPNANSPLAGLPVTLKCAIESGLDDDNVVSAPRFDLPQRTYTWTVTGRTKSGIFELGLHGRGMRTPITLPSCIVISSDLSVEADVTIDGAPDPADGAEFVRDIPRTVRLIPQPDSPMAGRPVALKCTIKSGLTPFNVQSTPSFNSLNSDYSWEVIGRTNTGTFQLGLHLGGLGNTPITLAISKLV